jgi:hypothetical protein
MSTPMRRTGSPCCARAVSGHAPAPPSAAEVAPSNGHLTLPCGESCRGNIPWPEAVVPGAPGACAGTAGCTKSCNEIGNPPGAGQCRWHKHNWRRDSEESPEDSAESGRRARGACPPGPDRSLGGSAMPSADRRRAAGRAGGVAGRRHPVAAGPHHRASMAASGYAGKVATGRPARARVRVTDGSQAQKSRQRIAQ